MIENRIYHSSDSPQYFYTSSISEEFDQLFLNLLSIHLDLPFHIFAVFRCLPKKSNWKTKGRFYITNDSKNTVKGELCLGIDVVVLEEELEIIPNIRINKVQQRLLFGKELITFLIEKMAKSTKKVPYLLVHKDEILLDIRQWCLSNYWLKEDKPIDFDIKNWTLPRAELIFGKPFFKNITDKIDDPKILKTTNEGMKYQNLAWHINENRQIESWFYLNEKKEWICSWFLIR
jgi:hypothetical protein